MTGNGIQNAREMVAKGRESEVSPEVDELILDTERLGLTAGKQSVTGIRGDN